jgi:hypothetical protein
MGSRKRYTPEEKVKILREIVEDGKTVSAVAVIYVPLMLEKHNHYGFPRLLAIFVCRASAFTLGTKPDTGNPNPGRRASCGV